MSGLILIRMLGYGRRILSSKTGRYALIGLCLLLSLWWYGRSAENRGIDKAQQAIQSQSTAIVAEQHEKGKEIRNASNQRSDVATQKKSEVDKDVENALDNTESDNSDLDGMSSDFADRMRGLQEKHRANSDSRADPY